MYSYVCTNANCLQAVLEPEPEVGCWAGLRGFVAECGGRIYETGRSVVVQVTSACCAAYESVRDSRVGSWAASIFVDSMAMIADQATAWISWGR